MELKLTSSQQGLLKWIALVLMTLDHVGMLLEPYEWLRLPGRVVYPIFAYLIAYNYLYNTRNKERYLTRLFVWAIISQPVYMFVVRYDFNVLFTLLFGVLVVYSLEHKKPYITLLLCFWLIPLSMVTSYGIAGIALIPVF